MYSETFARYCTTAGPSYTYTANYCVVAYINSSSQSCNHYYKYYSNYSNYSNYSVYSKSYCPDYGDGFYRDYENM